MFVNDRTDWPRHRPECLDAPVPGRVWFAGCNPDGGYVRPDGVCDDCGGKACPVCGLEDCPDGCTFACPGCGKTVAGTTRHEWLAPDQWCTDCGGTAQPPR